MTRDDKAAHLRVENAELRALVAQLQEQLGGAPYTTVASPLQSLQKKGFVTKTGAQMDSRYHALPKQTLLVLACERHLAELEATSTERAHVLEALRHG